MLDDVKRTDLFCDYYEKWVKVYKEGAIRKVTLDKYKMTLAWVWELFKLLYVVFVFHNRSPQKNNKGSRAFPCKFGLPFAMLAFSEKPLRDYQALTVFCVAAVALIVGGYLRSPPQVFPLLQ